MPYRNGRQGMVSGLQPTSAKSCISLHPDPELRAAPPLWGLEHTSAKFLGLWWDSHISFKKHISVLKTQCKDALNLNRMVAHLNLGGDRDTLLLLYWAIFHSKVYYGCIVYGSASNTDLRQLDTIHNSGLRLALGAFCTSRVPSLYTEANGAPLQERRLKLSMHYYLKARACINNPAHHALYEFDRTTKRFICSQAKWERRHDPTPDRSRWSQSGRSHDLCRDQCRISLPPEDIQLSTRNTRLRSQETRPHWRSKQMHDLQTKSPG